MSAATLQTDELAALRETVTAVCRAAGGTASVRGLSPDGPGYDTAVWRVLADQVGIAALGLPEAAGGLGGLAELCAVGEVLGATLTPVPFLSSVVLSGQLLSRCGSVTNDLLERLAVGEVMAGVLLDADGRWAGEPPLRADLVDRRWAVTGTADFVLDGPGATLLLTVARGPDGPALLAVELPAPGAEVVPLATLDLSRAQARVVLDAAPARLVASGPSLVTLIDAAVDVTLIVQASELLGAAQTLLDLTVDYARTRHQFGRPIGSFQAVQHQCAQMLLDVETSRSAVDRAVAACGPECEPVVLAEAASVAKAWCADALVRVSAAAVHLHGGIGFTWEHDAHLYFRRARADAALLGDPTFHRERLARLLAW